MNIENTVVDSLNNTITITILKEDYKTKFESELKSQSSKAQIKGFRKGKTPTEVVKKMYGKSILADTVNNVLQDALSKYFSEADFQILGQPIPSEDQVGDLNFDVNNLVEYVFKFDIGVKPDVVVKGISPSDSYNLYQIEVDDKLLDEELDIARSKRGTQETIENAIIEDKDIVTLHAKELDGDKIKPKGWATEFDVIMDSSMDPEVKDALLGKTIGNNVTFDIYKIEANRDEAYVKKYLLQVPENSSDDAELAIGNMFEAEIAKVTRMKKADLDEAFYDGYFGPGVVTNEAEAKAKISEYISGHYQSQAMQVMYRDINTKMMEDTKIDLPEAFLKRWLLISNENLTEKQIDEEFHLFLDGMKWDLILEKLSSIFEIQVDREDIYTNIRQKVMGYFGQYGGDESFINQFVNQLLENKEEVNRAYTEVRTSKIFSKIGDQVIKIDKKISMEDFKDVVAKLNEKQD